VIGSWVDSVLSSLPAWLVYLTVFLLPFAEAGVLLGFVIPGETALVFGGVLAGRGEVNLTVVLVLAIVGAVLGDSVGYFIGRRYGVSIKTSRLGQKVGDARWRPTEAFVNRRGGPAVLLGRFTAVLRALVPGVAGMAGLPYRTFLVWNVVGGALWASLCVLGGYVVGDVIGTYLTDLGYVLIGLVVVVLGIHFWRRHRSKASAA